MTQVTIDAIKQAIAGATAINNAMFAISNATELTWPQINQAIEISRSARTAAGNLLTLIPNADRNVNAKFVEETGVVGVDIGLLFTNVVVQGELYNDAAFALFDANNTREKIIPVDPAEDRFVQEVKFSGTDIDPIKAAALVIVGTLSVLNAS